MQVKILPWGWGSSLAGRTLAGIHSVPGIATFWFTTCSCLYFLRDSSESPLHKGWSCLTSQGSAKKKS